MFDTLMTLINACENDVYFFKEDRMIDLTINDFEGFDNNWNEIMRDYDNPNAVDALLDWLNANCVSKVNEFYTTYSFDGFAVKVGYASFDI